LCWSSSSCWPPDPGRKQLVKLNKIYTRTGDGGSAGLVDGSRASKAGPRMTAIGEVDEANSAIGVAIAALGASDLAQQLRLIQNELFDLGADIATPGEMEGALRITADQVTRLELGIDAMNEALAPLTSFILPGGSADVAALHLARAITRRAERAAVALSEAEEVGPQVLAYLNRLSDYLFVAARHVAAGHGGDVLWQPGATRG
jgi:cob(I)alamin adenosyltransferase